MLAVNARGVLGVASVDQRGQPGDHCQEIFFTASLDGGRTFLPEQRVSSAPCADTFGDYFGIVTTPDGRFRRLWPELRDGVSTLRTIIVEVEGSVVDRK